MPSTSPTAYRYWSGLMSQHAKPGRTGPKPNSTRPGGGGKAGNPYTPEEYRALMDGYQVGDPVRVVRTKQPRQQAKGWNPPYPQTGVIVYIHPDGYFATVEFKGKSGKYREAFVPYELARRAK